MNADDYAKYLGRVEAAKKRAAGRWSEILAGLGIDARILKRRCLPCPVCADGIDRFQYRDKFAAGDYLCRKCGVGDGFKLLMAVRGVSFHGALGMVENALGLLPGISAPAAATSEDRATRLKPLMRRTWQEARSVVCGDAVDRYIRSRLPIPSNFRYPVSLRCHPSLGYYRRDGDDKPHKVAEYTAMLACAQGADGRIVTLHRTYLNDGAKLDVPDVKKVMCGGYAGAAVRLAEATDELAVCEGIETGLALWCATGIPVWCAMNARNLEQVLIPDSVRRLIVFGDNDADADEDDVNRDFTGQASAYALARRAKREKTSTGIRRVQVRIPEAPGTDWADVFGHRLQAMQKLAA